MKRIHRLLLLFCPLLCSSCYDMHVEIGNRTFYNSQASNRPDLQICPLENVKIHCSIIGGLDFDYDRKEFVGTPVDYQVRIRRSDSYEYTPFQGTTRSDIDIDWNISGIPPGTTRLSLWIKTSGDWEEKDFVEIPTREGIPPVTVTLKPNNFNELDSRLQSWEGVFVDPVLERTDRSPQAVIDRVVVGCFPSNGIDMLEIEFGPDQPLNGSANLVGLIESNGIFAPSGIANAPYPAGLWRVKPSNTPPYSARSWSMSNWKEVRPLALTVYYRCSL